MPWELGWAMGGSLLPDGFAKKQRVAVGVSHIELADAPCLIHGPR